MGEQRVNRHAVMGIAFILFLSGAQAVAPVVSLESPSGTGVYWNGVKTISFKVTDADSTAVLKANVQYSAVETFTSWPGTPIVSNMDLNAENCGDSDFTTQNTCTLNWNTASVQDKNYYIYVEVIDSNNGNETASDSTDNAFAVDNMVPETPAFTNTNVTWKNTNANITLSCNTDGNGALNCYTITYKVDNDSNTVYTGPFTISSDGDHPIAFFSTDAAGNVSPTTTIHALVDKTAPTINGQSPASSSYTTDNTPLIEFDLNGSPSGLITADLNILIDGNVVTVDINSSSISNGKHYSYQLPYVKADGVIQVQVFNASDNADNDANLSYSFTVDTMTPTSLTISLPDFTNTGKPSISLSATDASGISKMVFACTDAGLSSGTEVNYATSYSDFNILLGPGCSGGDGTKTVFVKFKDNAGNSYSSSVSDSTNYDTTKPSAPSISSGPSASGNTVTLSWSTPSDGSGSGINNYKVYRGTVNTFSSASLVSSPTGTTHTDTGLSDNTYYYWVKAVDKVGLESDESQAGSVAVAVGGSSNPSGGGSSPTTSDGCDYGSSLAFSAVPGNGVLNASVTSSQAMYSATLRVKLPNAASSVKLVDGDNVTVLSGSVPAPTPLIGTVSVILFANDAEGDSCNTTKNIAVNSTLTASDTNDAIGSGNDTGTTDEEGAGPTALISLEDLENGTVEDQIDIAFNFDILADILAESGFAENRITGLVAETTQLARQNNLKRTIERVRVTLNGVEAYALRVTLRFTNASSDSGIEFIEDVPKALAQSASLLASDTPFTVVKEDPQIKFSISSLVPGQEVIIRYWATTPLSELDAQGIMALLQDDFTAPALMLRSAGTPTDVGSAITGLAGFVGANIAWIGLGVVIIWGVLVGMSRMRNAQPAMMGEGLHTVNNNWNSPLSGLKVAEARRKKETALRVKKWRFEEQ
ncbi:MAG: hypothetical protein HY393_01755 [Candidatus Diapherotrites archaeon]|nr:hypothetical protein [Candidatus Diapherotrites archaeon]